jgi:hypothetical protein
LFPFTPATNRSASNENEKLCATSHRKEYRQVCCDESCSEPVEIFYRIAAAFM